MYDSTDAVDIPRHAVMVAGYIRPSRFAWSAADWARFPHAVKVRIGVDASVDDGHVLDVEPGLATPRQAPGWVRRRRAAVVTPSIYCNLATWPAVRSEFRRQGVPEPHYWIAKYDNDGRMLPGAVAKQYADPPTHGGGHFDLSIVADHWPGVDKEDDMQPTDVVRDPGPNRWGHTWLNTNQLLNNRTFGLAALAAQLKALTTAVAADKNIAPTQLQLMLDTAVAKAMDDQQALLEAAVREAVPDGQADQIVAKLTEKLGAGEGN